MVKNSGKTGRTPDPGLNNKKGKTKSLPKYYFPLIFGIIGVEAIILVLCLIDIIPLKGPLEIYMTAGYYNYIQPTDVSRLAVTITPLVFLCPYDRCYGSRYDHHHSGGNP